MLSVLLGPHIWGPVLIIVSVLRSGLDEKYIRTILPLLLLFQFIIPVGYLHYLRKIGKLSSWDMTLREERPTVMFVGLTSIAISLFVVYFLGNQLLLNLTLVSVILVAVSLAITKFWKISLHAEVNTAGPLVLNFLFGWTMPLLYLTVPITLWARYTLHKHTLSQLLAGVAVGTFVTLGLFFYFGYISV